MTNDTLVKAIAYLGAVEVAPGLYARCEAPGSVPFEIIPEAILREYTPERIARFGNRDRQFCGIVTMPSWWTPSQQFAWRAWMLEDVSGPNEIGSMRRRDLGTFSAFDDEVRPLIERGAHWQRITANLETGEEVPA